MAPPIISLFIINHRKNGKLIKSKVIGYFTFVVLNNITAHLFINILDNIKEKVYCSAISLLAALTIAIIMPFIVEFSVLGNYIRTDKSKNKYNVLFYIISISLVAATCVAAHYNYIWADEGYSIMLARMRIPDMIQETATDVHPPLYYIFLKILIMCFGNKAYTYTLSALIPYIIMMLFSILIIKKEFGKKTSLFFSLMLTLLDSSVRYNVEVRMYSLCGLFVVIAYYMVFKIFCNNREKRWYIYLMLTSLGAAYTHYYGLVAVSLIYAYTIGYLIFKKDNIKYIVLSGLGSMVLYLPWFIVLFNQFLRVSDGYWIDNIPTIIECVSFIFASKYGIIFFLIWITGIITSFILEIINIKRDNTKTEIVIRYSKSKFLNSNLSRWECIGILVVLGSIIVGYSVSKLIHPMLMLRYLYPVSLIAWLEVSILLSKKEKIYKIFRCIIVILLSAQILYFANNLRNNILVCKNIERTIEQSEQYISEHNTIILSDHVHITWTLADYYFPQVIEAQKIEMEHIDNWQLEKGNNYLLFVTTSINERCGEDLEGLGYTYKYIVGGGNLGGVNVNVYHLEEINSADN